MCEIGQRLREERERLNLNQTNFSALGGVTLNSQSNYEKGVRSPDGKYLSAIAKAGVDVQYIITGIRAGQAEPLKPDEEALLDSYRHSSAEGKAAIAAAGVALAQQEGSCKKGAA